MDSYFIAVYDKSIKKADRTRVKGIQNPFWNLFGIAENIVSINSTLSHLKKLMACRVRWR